MAFHGDRLVDDALSNSNSATAFRIGRGLASAFRGKAVLETREGEFDPWLYASSGDCTVEPLPKVHSQFSTGWAGPAKGAWTRPETSWLAIRWRGHSIVVLRASWTEARWDRVTSRWVIADSQATARAFFLAVTEWCHVPRREILTFNGGCWSKSDELYEEIARSSFDDLILAGDLKAQIRGDFERFLASRAEYARYGVPWKRGVLFLGPPGNGKTHCLRATIQFLGVPCLYVQSLQSRYETDDSNILKVFKHARTLTPCCLVFEDLDAMITLANRSFFLNQLDGFAENAGILTLATSNHPERLDPAILNRPSRFDRKYHFELPGPEERLDYIRLWNGKFERPMRISKKEERQLASETDGFSFAYIKELLISAMVRWMASREPGGMRAIVDEQLAVLREHMRSEADATKSRERIDGMLTHVRAPTA